MIRHAFGRLCAVLLLSGSATAAFAAPKPVCRLSPEALVVSRERLSSVGEDIYVRRLPGPADRTCRFAPRRSDWVVGRGEPVYVMAFEGPILALDSGTSPDRELLVYNVVTRKKLVAVQYDDGENKVALVPDSITYWKVEPGSVPAKACPADWQALPDNREVKKAHRTTQMRLTFADGKTTPTGAKACRVTQDDTD